MATVTRQTCAQRTTVKASAVRSVFGTTISMRRPAVASGKSRQQVKAMALGPGGKFGFMFICINVSSVTGQGVVGVTHASCISRKTQQIHRWCRAVIRFISFTAFDRVPSISLRSSVAYTGDKKKFISREEEPEE